MATKQLNRTTTLTANQVNLEAGTGDTPPAGLTWTVVELRPYFAGKGDYFLFVDDQQRIQISSEDVATYGKPLVLGVTIKQPVILHDKFTDRSGASNFVGVDFTVEETVSTA